MTAELLETIEIETAPNPQWSVIFMHGLGADGNDFVPVVKEMNLPTTTPVRFVFPHAPMMPVTVNGGYVMRAWYDIVGADISNRADEAGVRRSQVSIEQLIARENSRGIPSSHIFLAGFSQGGAIALQTGLRYAEPLAGILALSTYLPIPHTVADEASPANKKIPIFMAHGTHDQVIPLALAKASKSILSDFGYQVEWVEYPMQHSVCWEEIEEIGKWFGRILTPTQHPVLP